MFWLSKEKRLRMVWEIERDGVRNFLAGSAHFFPYIFRKSLVEIIGKADVVLLEGPLDETNMNKVRREGNDVQGGEKITCLLDKEVLAEISREFTETPPHDSSLASHIDLFSRESETHIPEEIDRLKPWMAFFAVWSHYLKQRGWIHSVDLEVLSIAGQLGKEVCYLETIEEQIEALNGIPLDRILSFFKKIKDWEKLAKSNMQHYLKGDIVALLAAIEDFPSHCESIVEKRDPVMFRRMKHFFEKGKAAVFVGTTHVMGITRMLEEDGYRVRKYEP